MWHKKLWTQSAGWIIPLLYAGLALAAGLTFPRMESRILSRSVAGLSVATATAIYSAIASGMITLTGVVFSLTFVIVQFSATVYSPRLVLWIARDRVMSHAFGLFTATFLYAIAALAGVDRHGSGRVPFVDAWIVVALLVGSISMFISLIHRIGRLQIGRMLIFAGNQGRDAIRRLYAPLTDADTANPTVTFSGSPVRTLIYRGKPQAVQAVDLPRLVALAKAWDVTIEMAAAIGDTIMDGMPLLQIFGAHQDIDDRRLKRHIALGEQRTFEQDPTYAIRILVDIAIRALSSAINDPTTAVQALDQIEDLLLLLGRCNLETGRFRSSDGKVRLMVPFPTWEDLTRLAFDEIQFYGAKSVQVMRRLNALIADLISLLPAKRHAALRSWEQRLKSTIERSFAQTEYKLEASVGDRQGLGVSHRNVA